jgi:UDP-GlcNAc:undecaprenyl-phosphate GlcNAc-1-phosphate transferase
VPHLIQAGIVVVIAAIASLKLSLPEGLLSYDRRGYSGTGRHEYCTALVESNKFLSYNPAMNHYGLIALVAFIVSLLLVLVGFRFFPKLKLMDRPEKYGFKRKPIPYYGGILIFLAFMICVCIFVPFSRELLGLLVAASLIAITGFFDDYFCLNPIFRLIVQVIAAIILVFFGVGILSISNPLGGIVDLNTIVLYGIPVLGAIFTVIWIVLVTNTMNFLDGVPGLSSGVTFISAITIFFLSIRPGIHADIASQATLASIALILAFVVLAFLIFDFPPARMLMGDTGSTFLGFMLAALAIYSGGKVATAFLVLGVPILDAGWVILRRVFEGKKPWKGDYKHLHHRLLSLGLSEKWVLFVVYGLSLIFGAVAVLATSTKQKFFIIISLFVLMLVLVGGIVIKSGRNKK